MVHKVNVSWAHAFPVMAAFTNHSAFHPPPSFHFSLHVPWCSVDTLVFAFFFVCLFPFGVCASWSSFSVPLVIHLLLLTFCRFLSLSSFRTCSRSWHENKSLELIVPVKDDYDLSMWNPPSWGLFWCTYSLPPKKRNLVLAELRGLNY